MADGLELNVRDESREKLRCATCDGHLMCSPIRILPDGTNVCGRCSPLNKDAITYRNVALEAILEGAIFPCKFKSKGCTKRITFISDSNHESSCQYNNEGRITQIKTSGSTCAQEEFPESTFRGNSFTVPKAGSVCTDDSAAGPSTWNENQDRNVSEPASRANSTRSFDMGRAQSSGSRTPNNRNWNRHTPYRSRSYSNFVANGRTWQNPWMDDGQGRHINMYKRRNNLIIIKGGTFYVNW